MLNYRVLRSIIETRLNVNHNFESSHSDKGGKLRIKLQLHESPGDGTSITDRSPQP